MTEDRVTVAMRDGVADVRLNRPDKMNALDPAMFTAIAETGARLAKDNTLRAVVLSGEGAGFCAGLDMASFAAVASGGSALPTDIRLRTHGLGNLFQEVALVWRRVPVPVIAALHGPVFGGGLQIALGADIRLVAAEAKLSVMEIRWGLVPDMGGTLLMREILRGDVLRELCYSGRVVLGEEAVALGLATRVVPDPREAALAMAQEIAAKNPDAIRAGKRLYGLADEALAAQLLMAESVEQAMILGSPNQREATRANLEKRQPIFRDPERTEA